MYNILLLDDEIYSSNERHYIFEAFLENKWSNYIQMSYKEMRVPANLLTDDNLKTVLEQLEKEKSIFSVDYCNNVSDENINNLLQTKQYDAVFLDVVFDHAPVRTDFEKVLSTLRKYLKRIPPFFVYTAALESNIINTINNGFFNVFGDITPNKYYTFDNFKNLCKSTLMTNFLQMNKEREVVRKIISKSKGEVEFKPFQTNQISILHISDLQFGDKNTSEALNGLGHSIARNIGQVDLLIITGDVAMGGLAEEFNEGLDFLMNLRVKLWPNATNEERMERTIVIPGNHDFDLRTTILNYFNAKNKHDADGHRSIDFSEISKQLMEEKEVSGDNKYGLQAYREFAFQLTQRKEYLMPSLDFVDTRFVNWGICFYCLNSVGKITAKETNKVYLDKNSDKLITPKDALAIALCHHTLLCEAPKEIPECDLDCFEKTISGYVTGNKCKIIMGGHRHKSSSIDSKLKNNESYHICEAASLRVEGDEEEYIRGYNKYVLLKEKNVFTKIVETNFSISNDSSTFNTEKEYELPIYMDAE